MLNTIFGKSFLLGDVCFPSSLIFLVEERKPESYLDISVHYIQFGERKKKKKKAAPSRPISVFSPNTVLSFFTFSHNLMMVINSANNCKI